ncbi:MAG: ATP-binding protein, partial [Pseudonocardia sp.]
MPADWKRRMTGRAAALRAATRTVRGRTAIATLVIVGLASSVAAVVIVAVLRGLLAEDVAKATRLRVAEVSRQAVDTVVVTGKFRKVFDVPDPDDEFVQVLDSAGRVVGASTNVAGLPAQGSLTPDPVELTGPLAEQPLLLVVSGTVDTPRGPITVLVGHSLDAVKDATKTVAALLTGGLPPLLAVIGVTGWLLTGRALAPVEAIRTEVDAISTSLLDRRVSEPPGGDEITRLAQTMNSMLGRLEQSVQRQRRFVADASHELRSPIAAICQHAEVSLAHPTRCPTSELAATVLTEARRVQQLIDDLLLLARADEHSLDPHREPVDLDDLVFEEASRLRSDTTLRVGTSAVSAGRVDGDPAALRRLLRNLVDNAARHATRRVSLGLAEHNGNVLLTVEDDGPGIPEPDRARVLERFVRLDESRARDRSGSGPGLATVNKLAQTHHAGLRIGSRGLGGAQVE